MAGTLLDLKRALRQLRRAPGVALLVAMTLAIGIGPNTAIFSVVRAVLLQPLPYEDPERLALVRIDLSGLEAHPGLARAEVLDIRERASTLEDAGAVTREFMMSISTDADEQAVLAASVTPNLLPMLGVGPQLGSHFDQDQELPQDGDGVGVGGVLLSHRLWQARFGGRENIIGEQVHVNGRGLPIQGVLPPDFQLLLGPGTSLSPEVDLWMPLQLDPEDRDFWAYRTIVRLRDGVTLADARAEVARVGEELVQEFPAAYENAGVRFYLSPLHEDLVAPVRPAILVLFGAVALVLLIACTNAAGLLLARMKARAREMAVRSALGAARIRLIRQVVFEGLGIGLLAATLGLAMAVFGLRALLALHPGDLPRLDRIGIDGGVLAFTLGTAVLAAVLSSLLPAWQASRPNLVAGLREGGRSGAAVRWKTRVALVSTQVAFSIILLVGAGLLVRSFARLQQVDLGMRPEGVTVAQVPLDTAELQDPEQRWAVYRELLRGLRARPEVIAAGGVSLAPLGNQGMMASYATDDSLEEVDWNGLSADYRFVLPGYFETVGTRLLTGRLFEERDNEHLDAVAVVDVSLANQAWPDQNPIGQRLRIGLGTALDDAAVEVVGVVEHARIIDVRNQVRPQIYLPYRLGPGGRMHVVVATAGAIHPGALLQEEARRADTGRPVHSVRPLTANVERSMADTRFTLLLMTSLAFLALLLSTVGIYGLIATLARLRERETGLRLALGADRASILTQHIREGVVVAAFGLPFGLLGALALARSYESLLFGVGSRDLATFLSTPVLILLVAGAASVVPALRASHIDPATTLRDE